MHLSLYKVVFKNPPRTFFVRADTSVAAFDIAKTIETVLERPDRPRLRSLTEAVIDAITRDDEEEHRRCVRCRGGGLDRD